MDRKDGLNLMIRMLNISILMKFQMKHLEEKKNGDITKWIIRIWPKIQKRR